MGAAAGSRTRPAFATTSWPWRWRSSPRTACRARASTRSPQRRTRPKRMIYYYFGDKEGLYGRVLEEAYREVRAGEQELELDHLPPVEALDAAGRVHLRPPQPPPGLHPHRDDREHPSRRLSWSKSELIRLLNAGAIQKLEAICRRGREPRLFRDDVTPLELHWHISALSFFNVSNRATFSHIFGDAFVCYRRPGDVEKPHG